MENTDEQKHKSIDTVISKETTKSKKEDITKSSSPATVTDCAASVVSSVSIATEASKKISKGESTLTPPSKGDGTKKLSTNNMSVSQINSNISGSACVVGGGRVEENDNQSSDGWETVEPKGGRSKRLAGSTSKSSDKQSNEPYGNVPPSPNAGRRNKGKSKSRQRTKQRAKEKDAPKRVAETLEEGIVKRGANTIKLLMEERNKRPSVNTKKLTEAPKPPKQVSARSSIADQNTAQTIPESLSGVSSAPVRTLVGPGNNNSASSSVASSLEAPHATRHKPHHHHDSCEGDDVGYHLLKVCERLSSDMNTFMRRRSSTLTLRRRERGALLAALQDTVQVSFS